MRGVVVECSAQQGVVLDRSTECGGVVAELTNFCGSFVDEAEVAAGVAD